MIELRLPVIRMGVTLPVENLPFRPLRIREEELVI